MIQNVLCSLGEPAEAYLHKVVFADKHTGLTYRRLSDLSMRIDSVSGRRTSPRHPAPVLAEKSVFILTTLMGIVRVGCFYILPDAGQPAERLNRILGTLQTDLMIADKKSLSLAGPVSFSGEILSLEDLVSLPDNTLSSGLPVSIHRQSIDTDPLYGISASGSTGVPKGVMASHYSVIDFIGHFADLFHITQDDIIGNQTPFDPGVSVKDIYSAPKTGATLEVIPEKLFSIPIGLLDYLCNKKIITAIQAVSAPYIITTLKDFTYRVPSHLNKILFSGEVMPVEYLNTWRSCLPKVPFVNLYGPMEVTYNCTYCVMDRESEPGTPIPIERPFPNETAFLPDENSRLITEPGQSDEFCVARTALALGYYRDPWRTAMVSAQSPLNSRYPETIYRAGDLACYGRDGLLYLNGRRDFQVEHVRYQIEFDEVEAALETVEGVGRAIHLLLEEKNKVVAFYEGIAVRRNVAISLESFLPHYMPPNLYRNLTELPCTGNGKVNWQALRRLCG